MEFQIENFLKKCYMEAKLSEGDKEYNFKGLCLMLIEFGYENEVKNYLKNTVLDLELVTLDEDLDAADVFHAESYPINLYLDFSTEYIRIFGCKPDFKSIIFEGCAYSYIHSSTNFESLIYNYKLNNGLFNLKEIKSLIDDVVTAVNGLIDNYNNTFSSKKEVEEYLEYSYSYLYGDEKYNNIPDGINLSIENIVIEIDKNKFVIEETKDTDVIADLALKFLNTKGEC